MRIIEANIEKSHSKSQNRTRLSRELQSISAIWLFRRFFCGAEELENIIECIAIFYQMGKTKLDYVRKERYHDIKFNRTEVYFRPHVNVKLAWYVI